MFYNIKYSFSMWGLFALRTRHHAQDCADGGQDGD